MKKNILVVTNGQFPDGMASAYRLLCYNKAITPSTKVKFLSPDNMIVKKGKSLFYKQKNDEIDYEIILNKEINNKYFKIFWEQVKDYVLAFMILKKMSYFKTLFIYKIDVIALLFLIPILKMFGKKICIELNELPYETGGSKITRIKFINKMLKNLMNNHAIPRIDKAVCISENLAEYYRKHNKKGEILKVPILVDRLELEEIETEDLGNYIFHSGSMSIQKDGIVKMFEAIFMSIKELREKHNYQLNLIITNKKTFPEIWKAIEKVMAKYECEDHLVVTGYLEKNEMENYLVKSKMFVINKPNSMQNKYNFPTKVGDYLLSGSPIVAACQNIELNNFLQDGENALVVPSDDIEQMHQSIMKLILDDELREKIGKNGKKTAQEKLYYKNYVEKFKAFLVDEIS